MAAVMVIVIAAPISLNLTHLIKLCHTGVGVVVKIFLLLILFKGVSFGSEVQIYKKNTKLFLLKISKY